MADDTFDIVVLGAGSGGYACALRAARLGLKVALVEKDKVGGTCLHRGCIPTKSLLHAAETADAVRHAKDVGIIADFAGVDPAGLLDYQDRVVGRLYQGLQGLIASQGIELFAGDGTLVGPGSVRVGDRTLKSSHVVLATGSSSKTIPGLDPDGERVLTSDQALRLDHVPAEVVVLGGGVIGVEFASAWRSLGAEVTIVEALPRLLSAEEEASSRALERAFRKRGITVTTGAAVRSVVAESSGVQIVVEKAGTVSALRADCVLVAVGRAPVTDRAGFREAGLDLDRGFVVTDESLRTSIERTYAVGDIVAGPQLAHRGFQHGIFVAEHIAGLDPVLLADALIPRVTYSDPEVASVGLTEDAARALHGPTLVETVTYDLGGNGKSQILGTAGFVKLVRLVDGPVVGVHVVGSRAGELIGEAQAIVAWEAHPDEVAHLIHAHPSQNEALGEAHLALAGKALHAHS